EATSLPQSAKAATGRARSEYIRAVPSTPVITHVGWPPLLVRAAEKNGGSEPCPPLMAPVKKLRFAEKKARTVPELSSGHGSSTWAHGNSCSAVCPAQCKPGRKRSTELPVRTTFPRGSRGRTRAYRNDCLLVSRQEFASRII